MLPAKRPTGTELEAASIGQIRLRLFNPSFSTRGCGDPESRSRWASWLKGLYHRSHVVLVLIQKLSARANAWWRLGRQREVELFKQEFVVGLWMGVADSPKGRTRRRGGLAEGDRCKSCLWHMGGTRSGTVGTASCNTTFAVRSVIAKRKSDDG